MAVLDELNEKIAAKKLQLEQLENRKKQAENKLKERDRKLDTRRKILLGGWVMSLMQNNEAQQENVMRALDKYLTKATDRKLFDLPTLNQ